MKPEEQLELLTLSEEVSGIGHWRLTLATGDLYWSPEVYRIHGVDPETFLPTLDNGLAAYHPDDRERVNALIGRAIEARQNFEFQLRLIRPDGAVRLVDCSGRCRSDEGGELVSLFGVFQDVTDRFAELRRRNEGLEHFSYAVAHDLRAPLNTIVGFTELLGRAMGDAGGPRAKVYLEKIVAQATTMKSLVAEVMRYAKSSVTNEGWEPVALSRLVHNAVDTLSKAVADSGATIEVEELPTVLGMPLQLQLLFQNLVQNAIKYARSDVPPLVRITAHTKGPQVLVSVSDNGVGFPEDAGPDLFRPFRRLGGNLNESDGMGMGLAICRRIMDTHGGTISAASESGQGATFVLAFCKV